MTLFYTAKVVYEQKVPTEPDDIVRLLASIGEDYGRVGIDAGPLSQWLVNGLMADWAACCLRRDPAHDGAFEDAADQ
jgi:hypothetical protein